MKLFKNKFFIICLCIAVVLCAVPTTFSLMGYRSLSKNIVGTVTLPFRFVITSIGNGFEGFGRYFQSVNAVHERNEALQSELNEANQRLEEAKILEAENERLRAYLGMKEKYPSFTMEEGMVVSYSSTNYMTSFTLNKGTLHGIRVNMPVVTVDGIVGCVTEVGLNWCMVSSVIENASSVGAYIPRSGATGIVTGDASMKQEGICRMRYIENDADIQVGDRVLSNGNGVVYPADLPIGEVISVEVDEYSRARIANIKPYVDLNDLRYMMIITGYSE